MDKKNSSNAKPQTNPKQQPAQKPGSAAPKNPSHKKEQF